MSCAVQTYVVGCLQLKEASWRKSSKNGRGIRQAASATPISLPWVGRCSVSSGDSKSFTSHSGVQRSRIAEDGDHTWISDQKVSFTEHRGRQGRRAVHARAADGDFEAVSEQSLKTTVELDKFIDTLRNTEPADLPLAVAEHVLAFDTNFWLRLAARADTCASIEERRQFEDLAASIMAIVERLVRKTQESIESATDVLQVLLQTMADENGEILWPPSSTQKLADLREAIRQEESRGRLDEGFLSALSAQLRQAKEMNDRPGLIALLQRVFQHYAAVNLTKRSYATRPDGSEDQAEKLLESVIQAEEEEWDALLCQNLVNGGGQVVDDDLFKAIEKRMERTLMRTEGGSYRQRVMGEFLVEIETRAKATSAAFRAAPPLISIHP